jgi:hypothetical protein
LAQLGPRRYIAHISGNRRCNSRVFSRIMKRRFHTAFAVAAVVVSIVSHPTSAQECVPTLTGYSTGPLDASTAPDGRSLISTLMPYDDGSGPCLIAAGQFTLPPAEFVHVAKYKDGTWTPMPMPAEARSGIRVKDLAVQDFSSVGGPGRSIYALLSNAAVYRWTELEWQLVGSDLGAFGTSLLATEDAQGPLLLASGLSIGGIRAWRGVGDWGVDAPFQTDRLIEVDDGTGVAAFAVGDFSDPSRGISDIAKRVNGEWTAFPVPIQTLYSVSDLTSFDDGTHGPELHLSAVLFSGSQYSLAVYRLRDGEWERLNTAGVVFTGSRTAKFIKLDDGGGEKLFLSGYLRTDQQSGLVELTAAGWQAPLYFRSSSTDTPHGAVLAACRYVDSGTPRTFIGGDFASFSSSLLSWSTTSSRAFSLLRSDPAAPLGYAATALGIGELPNSFARHTLSVLSLPEGPHLLISGSFLRAGGLRANGAALFNGQSFQPMNLPGSTPYITLHASVGTFDGEQRIFAAASSGSLGTVCSWNGSQWVPMSQQPDGSQGYTAAVLNNEPLVLTNAGLSAYRAGSWTHVAAATRCYHGLIGNLGQGARFYFAGTGSSGPGVYQYDGQTVSLLAPTLDAEVFSMTIHDDGAGSTLYIGGLSATLGVVRLNDGALEPLPGGGVQGYIDSLVSYDDGHGLALYAAGGFNYAAGQPVNGLARWRDGVWEPVTPFAGSSPATTFRARLAVFQDKLYVAGGFTSLGLVNADHLHLPRRLRRRWSARDTAGHRGVLPLPGR